MQICNVDIACINQILLRYCYGISTICNKIVISEISEMFFQASLLSCTEEIKSQHNKISQHVQWHN